VVIIAQSNQVALAVDMWREDEGGTKARGRKKEQRVGNICLVESWTNSDVEGGGMGVEGKPGKLLDLSDQVPGGPERNRNRLVR
jgi:hypothetical protein